MIRWITERLGTAAWDHVSKQPDIYLLDVRDLVDKSGNSADFVKGKIEEGVDQLVQGKKVIVACDYGISRSNAIAAGILACTEGMTLDAAIRTVLRATGEIGIKVEVLSVVRSAVEVEKTAPFPPVSKASRVLITGAGGFIGTSVLRRPAKDFEALPVNRRDVDLLGGSVELDLIAKDTGANTLLHLANPRIYTTSESMGQTLCMLKNVLDVCRENNLRLVFLSGWEVYSGYRTQGLLAGEQTPLFPGGTYGQTKYLCEILIENYRVLHGIQTLVLRSSPVYGACAERPKFILNFLRRARNHETIRTHRYRNGFPALDLLHIDDLVDALVLAAQRAVSGVFNIGSGMAVATAEVADHLVKKIGSNSRIEHIDIDDYASNIVMDTRQAQSMLGWRPKILWRQGLDDVIASFDSKREMGTS